jgi:hypothetical protein
MAKVRLSAGAEIDLLTKGELDDSLKDAADAEWTARARGIKPIRVMGNTGSLSSTTVFAVAGPQQGYIWALRGLGLILSGAQTAQAYVTGDNGTTLPKNGLVASFASGTNLYTDWSGVQAYLNGGEYLAIGAGGSVSAAFILYALEVPAELTWKVI